MDRRKFFLQILLVVLDIIGFIKGLIENNTFYMIITATFFVFALVYVSTKNKFSKFYKKIFNFFDFFSKEMFSRVNDKYINRFEEVDLSKIQLGAILYPPFFIDSSHIKGKNGSGIGVDVLSKIFSDPKLESYNYKIVAWDYAFKALIINKIDIIVTPIFETRTRLKKYKNISFCSPIFFSNVGLYVKKNAETTRYSFSEALNYINRKIENDGWNGIFIKGEISESLLKKHFPRAKSIQAKGEHGDCFKEVFNQLKGNNKDRPDFVFMEVFKAESILNTGDEIINILENKELLYPVSFVVRKNDIGLRNFINIKILELQKKGEIKEIIQRICKDRCDIEEGKIDEIFITSYEKNKVFYKKL